MTFTWEGIEDKDDEPQRVWFSRATRSKFKRGKKDDNNNKSSSTTYNNHQWTPLRKCDCEILNKSFKLFKNNDNENEHDKVAIECGRSTADLTNHVIRYNFYNAPIRELGSAIWFEVIHAKSDVKERKLVPIITTHKSSTTTTTNASSSNEAGTEAESESQFELCDELIIEGLYKQGVKNQSLSKKFTGEDTDAMEKVLQQEINLTEDNLQKVYIAKSNSGTLSIRKRPKNFISLKGYTDLQRGYGDHIVDGEIEECALGPVRHLSFVIHGIGEAKWSKKEEATTSMIDEINIMRSTINKKMYNDWNMECDKIVGGATRLPPPNRIEFVPIEWYEQIHSSSSSLKKDLISTTLTTVPKLRSIANDVLFDVLVYNTPEFCGKVLECVTSQICDLHSQFQLIHNGFVKDGGTFSIVGHSLGSVIAWDILSILSDNQENTFSSRDTNTTATKGEGTKNDPIVIGYSLPSQEDPSLNVYENYLTQTESNLDEDQGTWGPSLPHRMTKTIPFKPKFTFFLGSPIGLFLTLRGARPHFNAMLERRDSLNDDDNEDEYHETSPFNLPSGSVYNIFSPNDPVAYRIEPLLLPPDYPTADLPSPCFLTSGGKGLRLHVQVKEIGDTIMKSFAGFMKSSLLEKIPKSASKDSSKGKDLSWKFALGGQSDRVDYQFQPGVVENEYLAAISAHNTYLRNEDLLEFWIQCANEAKE
jgi:hypothetical protein